MRARADRSRLRSRRPAPRRGTCELVRVPRSIRPGAAYIHLWPGRRGAHHRLRPGRSEPLAGPTPRARVEVCSNRFLQGQFARPDPGHEILALVHGAEARVAEAPWNLSSE